MRVVAIVPARMESTRFPGKPLVKIRGMTMIEHVRRRLGFCKALDEVIVATCNREILDEVVAHGGKAVMTSSSHVRCTDRIAEAARGIEADVIVNAQGDEPLVRPEMIDALIRPFLDAPSTRCTNLMVPIADEEEFQSRNAVKAVVDRSMDALYFSREPIPTAKMGETGAPRYKQLGMYGFSRGFLAEYTRMPPTPLEVAESVDMLRVVENGHRLRMVLFEGFRTIGVDVPSDVGKAEAMLAEDDLFGRY